MGLLSRLNTKIHPPIHKPKIPEGVLIYAIGDVHGELFQLERLLGKIEADALRRDADRKIIIFLGDVIDRGGHSRDIIGSLGKDPFVLPEFEVICLKGNHEQVMLDFFDHPETSQAWFQYGGVETLASYGIRAGARTEAPEKLAQLRDEALLAIPTRDVAFLRSLKTRFTLGDYFFVHAGVRPGITLDRQSAEDLLWIREPFLSSTQFHEKIIVHGHTVHAEPQNLPNRIGIDTGAYATGILTSLVLHGDQGCFLQSA